MKILHESLNSWKKRLENLRHSGQKSSVFTRSSGQNSPQNYLNVPAQDKFGYQPKIPAEMLHLKLKKKFGASLNESEYFIK